MPWLLIVAADFHGHAEKKKKSAMVPCGASLMRPAQQIRHSIHHAWHGKGLAEVWWRSLAPTPKNHLTACQRKQWKWLSGKVHAASQACRGASRGHSGQVPSESRRVRQRTCFGDSYGAQTLRVSHPGHAASGPLAADSKPNLAKTSVNATERKYCDNRPRWRRLPYIVDHMTAPLFSPV